MTSFERGRSQPNEGGGREGEGTEDCGAERHQGNSKNAIKRSEDGVPEAWAVPARPGGTSEEDWRKESE